MSKLINPGKKGCSNIEHIYSSLRGRYVVFEASLEFLHSLQERSMRLNFPTGQIMFTLGKHGESGHYIKGRLLVLHLRAEKL